MITRIMGMIALLRVDSNTGTNKPIGQVAMPTENWSHAPHTCRAIGRAGANRVSRKGTLQTLKNIVSTSTICKCTFTGKRALKCGTRQRTDTDTAYFAKPVLLLDWCTYGPAHVCGRSRQHDQRFPPLLLVILILHAVGLHHLRALALYATMQ